MIHVTPCLPEDRIPAQIAHEAAKKRHGEYYRTARYYLRMYRQRRALTQAALAERTGMRQHHLPEMEHDKRVIGKANARKPAETLGCDYSKLL